MKKITISFIFFAFSFMAFNLQAATLVDCEATVLNSGDAATIAAKLQRCKLENCLLNAKTSREVEECKEKFPNIVINDDDTDDQNSTASLTKQEKKEYKELLKEIKKQYGSKGKKDVFLYFRSKLSKCNADLDACLAQNPGPVPVDCVVSGWTNYGNCSSHTDCD